MKALIIVMLLIVVSGFSVNAQKVKVGANPAVDLTKYKTYAWAKGTSGPNPIINQIIVDAVDGQMAAKGLKKVESDPELTLVAWGSTESDLYVSSPSWTPAMNSISTGIASGAQSWPVTKGTLVVDMSDAKTKDGVWRGTATHTLENGPSGNRVQDAKIVEKPINKAVEKMFKQFPHPKK